MVNVPGDGNFTSKLNQALGASLGKLDLLLASVYIFLSITSCMGNALILIALRKVSSIHPPTKLFFRCLAVTDLCVGLLVHPLYATYKLSRITDVSENNLYYLYEVSRVANWILCTVSVLTSTGISVDRLLALSLGLRYRHVVTLRRVRVAVICFWFIGASVKSIRIWRTDITFMLASVFLTLSLITSIVCYTRIHLKLRQRQVQQQNNVPQRQANGGRIPLNIARHKKSVSSILWVQLALVACYGPWIFLAFSFVINGIENDVAWIIATTVVHFNSTLNPILYCRKIGEVRQAVKATIQQLNCIFFK